MQVLAFLVLPILSLVLWLTATWRVLDVGWLALGFHVLAPAIASYGLARRYPTGERGIALLTALGSAVAALVIAFFAVLVFLAVLGDALAATPLPQPPEYALQAEGSPLL